MIKNTKIVSTIGPASEAKDILIKMMQAGSNVFRLNFSHGDYESHMTLARNIRDASTETGQRVAIMQDLQGPKIRVSEKEQDTAVNQNEEINIVETETDRVSNEKTIVVDTPNVLTNLEPGHKIYIEDGKLAVEVIEIKHSPNIAKVRCMTGGTIKKRKGVNFPDTHLDIDIITEKDKKDMEFGLKDLKPDYIALSFFQSHKDVVAAKKIRDEYWVKHCPEKPEEEKPGIIIKLEKGEAVKDLENILNEVDAVMVARGDLGIETDIAKVPIIQKKVIQMCLDKAIPVIVATEMMASMEQNPRPTRAEVSDVANAVYDNADAVMTSGETTIGQYPVETVTMQSRISEAVEEEGFDRVYSNESEQLTQEEGLMESAVNLAENIGAKVIILVASGEKEARQISRYRPAVPVAAMTDSEYVANKLVLSWGIHPFVIPRLETMTMIEEQAKKVCLDQKVCHMGEKVVIVIGSWPWGDDRMKNEIKVVDL